MFKHVRIQKVDASHAFPSAEVLRGAYPFRRLKSKGIKQQQKRLRTNSIKCWGKAVKGWGSGGLEAITESAFDAPEDENKLFSVCMKKKGK